MSACGRIVKGGNSDRGDRGVSKCANESEEMGDTLIDDEKSL